MQFWISPCDLLCYNRNLGVPTCLGVYILISNNALKSSQPSCEEEAITSYALKSVWIYSTVRMRCIGMQPKLQQHHIRLSRVKLFNPTTNQAQFACSQSDSSTYMHAIWLVGGVDFGLPRLLVSRQYPDGATSRNCSRTIVSREAKAISEQSLQYIIYIKVVKAASQQTLH